jgi:tetratricopeptide (TPR) repeat protein
MKKVGIMLVLLLVVASMATADIQAILDRADQLHDAEDYKQVKSYLESSFSKAASGREKAELHWRMARVWLNLGDEAEDSGVSGQPLLSYFEKGEAEAQKAIDADANNHLGYYWKSANIGRWGQIKGILNSLAKAKPMRDLLQKAVEVEPEHADSYYVLGQLYEQVPGFPISFGDPNFAVSLGRKSLALHEREVAAGIEDKINYDFYTEMAKHLWARNFSAARRTREQGKRRSKYESTTDPMTKNSYYESVVSLKNTSDRKEAVELVNWVIAELEGLSNRTDSQEDDLKEARETLESW